MKIRDFNPPDNMMRIPLYALDDLIKKGFSYIALPNGKTIKITKDDLLFKREEIEALEKILELEREKNEKNRISDYINAG